MLSLLLLPTYISRFPYHVCPRQQGLDLHLDRLSFVATVSHNITLLGLLASSCHSLTILGVFTSLYHILTDSACWSSVYSKNPPRYQGSHDVFLALITQEFAGMLLPRNTAPWVLTPRSVSLLRPRRPHLLSTFPMNNPPFPYRPLPSLLPPITKRPRTHLHPHPFSGI